MSSSDLTNNLEETIKQLREERSGKVLRKIFWLFAGGDTGRWFEGKPQNSTSCTRTKKEKDLLARHYSTEFIAGRVFRTCTVNFELSQDKRNKIDRIMEKFKDYNLVKYVSEQKSETNQCWKLTKLGLACALSIKEDIKSGNAINWDIPKVKRKLSSLEKV